MTGNPFITIDEGDIVEDSKDIKPTIVGSGDSMGFIKPPGMEIGDGYLKWEEYEMEFDEDYVTVEVWEEFMHLIENGECDEHGLTLMKSERSNEYFCPLCERQ